MKCQHCGKRMSRRGTFCPVCGGDNSVPAVETEETQQTASPELKKVRRMALLSGIVAVLAILATVLFFGIRSGWQVGNLFASDDTVTGRSSYTVSDRKAMRKRNRQVAVMGDDALTNGQLQIYYWTEVYDFVSNYSYYLTAAGLDLSKPLDEQKLDPENNTLRYLMGNVDGNMTWQQYFLQGAIQMWQSNQAMAQLARENGYTLDAESQAKLDALPAELKADAKKAGFDNVEDYLHDSMGAGCTEEDYLEYMRVYYLGLSYFSSLYEKIQPTEEELESYFEQNEDDLRSYGITKDMGYTVDVRHILLTPDGKIPTHKQEFTNEQWEACRRRAQSLLEEFMAGDQSEESFAALAKTYSEDSLDNVAEGGLFTYVQEGEMEGEFNTWCFDESREKGHYGLVKTSYGYHIIYFVGAEDLWLTQTRNLYIREEAQKIVNAALDSHPLGIFYKKVVLGDVKLT